MPTQVNGERLDENEIFAEERSIFPRLSEAMQGEPRSAILARAREWARDNVIDRVLLRQAALAEAAPEREPMTAEAPAAAESVCLSRERANELAIRLERLTTRLTAKLMPPKAKDLSEYYRKNPAQFHVPDMVHAAHIVCNVDEKTSDDAARAAIGQAAERLTRGETFAEVADSVSDCPGRGGDLGFIARGQMVPEFDQVVFKLQPNEVSGIFRTPFGYHLARVIEYRPAGILKFDEVRRYRADLLYAQKKQRAIDGFVDRLRAKADIRDV
jgi:hypothetical protein